jgi:hypothetical protein
VCGGDNSESRVKSRSGVRSSKPGRGRDKSFGMSSMLASWNEPEAQKRGQQGWRADEGH